MVARIVGPEWMQGLTPNATALALAGGLVLLSVFVGVLVARVAGRRLEAWILAHAPTLLGRFEGRVPAILRDATAAILLSGFRNLPMFGPVSQLVIVTVLGLVVGTLVYNVARGLKLGATPALGLAFLVFLAVILGALGGLSPVLASLDSVGLSLGARRLTLLDVLNGALIAAIIFLGVRLAIRVASRWIGTAPRLDLSQRVLFQKLAQIGIVAIGLFLVVDLLGIDLTALAVFSGALGLAVGFGMQNTFGNLLAGLILLMDRSIKPGDVIVIGDQFGWVNKVGVRAVSVLTRDGKEHLIPNDKLMTEPVENWSYSDRNVRVHIPVGVSYNCDIHAAQKLMFQAAMETPRVLKQPPPTVWLRGFGDSSVDHDILVWINDPEQGVGNVQSEVLNRVWDLFKEHDIEIPFPQRDVHVRRLPEGLVERLGVRRAAE